MPDAAWTDRNLANPHAVADKAKRVEAMFAAIAPSYDLNNRIHSLWRDQAWRRAAVRMAELKPTDHVLDVACGTGDLTIAFADALVTVRGRAGVKPMAHDQVHGLDFTQAMLAVARKKIDARPHWPHYANSVDQMENWFPTIHWSAGDAMRLPLPDACVDVVSIAFGIRNVTDPAAAIREFHRVLRPGGRVIILEFSLPSSTFLRGLYNLYFRHVLPRTATWIARDRSGAYRYLPQSVNTFIDRPAMVGMLHDSGFTGVVQKPMTFGISVIYRGTKPALKPLAV